MLFKALNMADNFSGPGLGAFGNDGVGRWRCVETAVPQQQPTATLRSPGSRSRAFVAEREVLGLSRIGGLHSWACAMRIIARFNKPMTNPILRLWAHRLPYVAVIEHNGRKSRTSYQTPVMAFVDGGKLSVVLNYGPTSDWVRNVQAAGSAGVVHRGERYTLTSPRVIPTGFPELPPALRFVRTPAHSALHGTLAGG
jgi:deazaflavin-dependent oxidoreductase (nitroreductase family)